MGTGEGGSPVPSVLPGLSNSLTAGHQVEELKTGRGQQPRFTSSKVTRDIPTAAVGWQRHSGLLKSGQGELNAASRGKEYENFPTSLQIRTKTEHSPSCLLNLCLETR